MKRFMNDNSAFSFQFPESFSNDFKSLCLLDIQTAGSIDDSFSNDIEVTYSLPAAYKYSTFDVDQKQNLKKFSPSFTQIIKNLILIHLIVDIHILSGMERPLVLKAQDKPL